MARKAHAKLLSEVMKTSEADRSETLPHWAQQIEAQLTDMSNLKRGWDGHIAPAPNATATAIAHRYLDELIEMAEEPSRLGPAAFGGIACIHERETKEVYVAISNKGELYAMFIENGEVPDPTPFEPSPPGYKDLVEKIRVHLG